MFDDPFRIPVIVGVGQVNDRPATPEQGLDPIALMVQALRNADEDGGGGWLAACDSLAVVAQMAWPDLNPVHDQVASALGIAPAHCEQTAKPHGDSPVRLLHEAANRIGDGTAQVCAVVGGEALRTAGQLAARASASPGAKPNAMRDAKHRIRTGYPQGFGLVVPTDVYPLYENAGRTAYGQTLAEGQAESGALWSGLSRVAEMNEAAWIRRSVTAEEIVTRSPDNRPLAFPYTKLQVANSSVNQGAGFIVTSLGEARRRGIDEGALVFVGYGAAAKEDHDFLARDRFDLSSSLAVSIERTFELNHIASDDLACVELYSCFPCVPKMARRVLGWPLDRPISVVGGLTFGGGPIGNYMSHAVAAMVERLRGTADKGLLFANGGYATDNHSIVISGAPMEVSFPQEFDYQAEADAKRGPIPPVDRSYRGPATVETYTVFYDREGLPSSGVIVALTPAGSRCLAAPSPSDLEMLVSGASDPIGMEGEIVDGTDLARWSFKR